MVLFICVFFVIFAPFILFPIVVRTAPLMEATQQIVNARDDVVAAAVPLAEDVIDASVTLTEDMADTMVALINGMTDAFVTLADDMYHDLPVSSPKTQGITIGTDMCLGGVCTPSTQETNEARLKRINALPLKERLAAVGHLITQTTVGPSGALTHLNGICILASCGAPEPTPDKISRFKTR